MSIADFEAQIDRAISIMGDNAIATLEEDNIDDIRRTSIRAAIRPTLLRRLREAIVRLESTRTNTNAFNRRASVDPTVVNIESHHRRAASAASVYAVPVMETVREIYGELSSNASEEDNDSMPSLIPRSNEISNDSSSSQELSSGSASTEIHLVDNENNRDSRESSVILPKLTLSMLACISIRLLLTITMIV